MRLSIMILSTMVFVFTLGIAFFVTHFTVTSITDRILSVPELNQSSAARDAFNSMKTTVNRLDYIVFVVFMALILSMFIFGYFAGGHPLMMIVYFIIIVISIILSMILANVWSDLTTMGVVFGTTINSFPITNNIMTYLPLYSLIVGLIGILAMFSRNLVGGNQI